MIMHLITVCVFSLYSSFLFSGEITAQIVRPFEAGVYNYYMLGESTPAYPNGIAEEGMRTVTDTPTGQKWQSSGLKIYKDSKSTNCTEYFHYEHNIFRDLDGMTQMIAIGSAGNFAFGQIVIQDNGDFIYEATSKSDLHKTNLRSKWIYTKTPDGYEVKAFYENPKDKKWNLFRTSKLIKQKSS
jgi:hypothetical protein